ncbi:MAG: AAA family ATPase [Candidatus Paceibacterota bacterium]
MKLHSIQIKNYRSIEDISFEIIQLDDKSFTYGLIGVNEAGKSSILKALSLKDGLVQTQQKDFRDKSKPVEVIYSYELTIEESNECKSILEPIPDNLIFTDISLKAYFLIQNPTQINLEFDLLNITNEEKAKIQEKLQQLFLSKIHKSVFWTAEDKYLISQPIDLNAFANSPENVSIPLKNCFYLAGILNIQDRISSVGVDSTEIEQLQTELGEKVTDHIKTVWPNHPIDITFLINNGQINFHIKDEGVSGKAKTADQRSDGFKQFVSFLLTVSAQNKNDELANSILLLDEPETHLHPQAQEYLLGEFIKISLNNRNNIVFFATHSNYMIDKGDLSRNYRIKKESGKTEKNKFDKKNSTYASVTYEVFDIPSTDYHNEIYGKLHDRYQDADISDEKRSGVLNFDTGFLYSEKGIKKDKPWKGNINQATLPTYIRNCIHHPDNGDKYKDVELRKSIELLRSYL